WIALKHILSGICLQSADETGVLTIQLGVPLIASENDLVCIKNDDKVACIRMAGKGWFVFAGHHAGENCRKTADHLVLGINDVPLRGVWSLRLKKVGTGLLRLIRL